MRLERLMALSRGRGVAPRPRPMARAALIVASPLPFVLAPWARGLSAASPWSEWAWVGAVASALLAAGLALTRWPRLGQALGASAVIGTLGINAAPLLRSPVAALVLLVAAIAAIDGLLDRERVAGARRRRRGGAPHAVGATAAALGVCAAALLCESDSPLIQRVSAGLSALATLLVLGWALRARRRAPRVESSPTSSPWAAVVDHPERLFVGTFAGLCALGTLMLLVPAAAAPGVEISALDAAFTAVSAVCVTGLIVLDTPSALSFAGQAAVLVLIQVGGLGIMTFSTAVLRVIGRRMGLRHEEAVARLLSPQDRGDLFVAVRRILWMTAICELAGAAALFTAFYRHGDGAAQALWRATFTAISAFCNAGFALQSASLVPYQGDPFILHVIGLLIIAGGLSPVAVFALPRLLRPTGRAPAIQSVVIWVTTVALLVGGWTLFAAFEWDHALAGLSTVDRLHNAWFQSVTLRTAGFNSIALEEARPATLVMMLIWMFIGGAPGGAAGGVKVTTVAALALLVAGAMRGGLGGASAAGRDLSTRTLEKAVVVVALAISGAVVASVALLLTQSMSARLAIFEAVSALGTVGLSLGGTAQLDGVGKTIIIACMFIGRVGALSLLMVLSERRAHVRVLRPEEDLDVG